MENEGTMQMQGVIHCILMQGDGRPDSEVLYQDAKLRA